MTQGFTKFRIRDVIVDARKSPGGAFYDIVFPNGEKARYLADVFEEVAKPEPVNGNQP